MLFDFFGLIKNNRIFELKDKMEMYIKLRDFFSSYFNYYFFVGFSRYINFD